MSMRQSRNGLMLLCVSLFCVSLGLSSALPSTCLGAEAAKSLDQVPARLKTPEGKKVFEEQIEGKTPPDALGLHLPQGLTAKDIAALVLPPANKTPLNAVGAKPLPDQPDLYAAVVCTGGDVPTQATDAQCSEFSGSAKVHLQAYLGLLEMKPGAAPKLAAKPVAVNGLMDWSDTDLPDAPDAAQGADGGIAPSAYESLDLAPYRIAPDQRAFGLRGTWSDGYAGGFGSYNALYLFAVVDGALKQVLAVPMSSYRSIAGDWNKDGTRNHETTEGANVLIVTKQVTEGHFDLLLKSRTGKKQRLYQWSATVNAYQPAKKAKPKG
jgi:hypothetical protein